MSAASFRILDANLNRAREALRVLEDYARFVLDDADAAAAAKGLRHALRGLISAAGADALLTERDIISDVGRETKTDQELGRSTTEDVARAAFGRLGEALRSLGEYGKLLPGTFAAEAERLRYTGYELEQRVVLRGTLRGQFRGVRLYVLVTEAQCRGDWVEAAEAALRGGAGCLQLREKSLSDAELLRRAQRLRELTQRFGRLFIVNDRADIARLSRADGVHVGQDDLSVADARRIGGARMLVGKSTHTSEQLAAAIAEAPDYIAVGPMYPTLTKPQDHIAGPQYLAEAARRTTLPLIAIGGISAASAAGLIAAGASGVSVCSAVLGGADVEQAAKEFGPSG